MTCFRYFSRSSSVAKEIPKNLKGKSKSSQDWLIRQLKDPYVENAKMQNYRCRSAFKLLEIDAKFNIMKPGMCVVDCGAAPGSWTQVAVEKTNANLKDSKAKQGMVVAIDRLPIYPIEGATILGNCDFTLPSSQEKLTSCLRNQKVDVALSDMAPNSTGIKNLDHEAIVNLAYLFIRFSLNVSRVGGCLLVKLWEGNMTSKVENDLHRFYGETKRIKPPASRSDSSEVFLLAKGFRGIQ